MRRRLDVLALALLAASACAAEPEPLGEALVVIQTDVAVPRRINRLRVEVLGASGATIETRELVTPTAAGWPVSFSVVLPDGAPEQDFLLRLRAYPEGHEVSARELERLARVPPRNVTVHASIDDACREPPVLHLGEPLTLRRGSRRITPLLRAQGCTEETISGSAVARLDIAEAGDYRIEISHAVPDAANGVSGSDTAVSLRTDCRFPTTQVACAESIGGINHLSRLERVTLAPGTYFVVTGGADPAPADLTLLASRLDVFQPVPDPDVPPFTSDPAALEPAPGVTIDRLVAVRLRHGERGRVEVTLHGECFGTAVDLASRASCVDRAGTRSPVTPVDPGGPLTPDVAAPPPWPGDEHASCTVPPRADEVCVPSGAFVLGDTLALEDLERRSQPERMRVVEPFLLDKYEMSVGRFREAKSRGFVPPDATPLANDAPVLTREKNGGMCTWSASPLDRESLPLNCVTWVTARALCRFLGGDLPTEDQWEYAATAAGRDVEVPYPWGRDLPSCERTVYARTGVAPADCAALPIGPVRVDDPLLVSGDVTPLGIVALAGNVEELLATPFVPYSDPAWQRAGLRALLEEADAPMRAARGSDWAVEGLYTTSSTRRFEPVTAAYDNVGFRCARRGR